MKWPIFKLLYLNVNELLDIIFVVMVVTFITGDPGVNECLNW